MKLRLIHRKPEEAADHVARLRRAGHTVRADPFSPAELKLLGDKPPDAILIDLSRAPAQGRDLAVFIRRRKATRHVPIVFVEGEPAARERAQKTLPDATLSTWRGIRGALKKATSRSGDPVVPKDLMAAYAGTPLLKKLGIKKNTVVGLLSPPEDVEKILGPLPEGASLRKQARGRCDLILWFMTRSRQMEARIRRIAERKDYASIWMIWPKKASGIETDLNQQVVRKIGLGNGLVDYKIASVDGTWSGLRFTRRSKK